MIIHVLGTGCTKCKTLFETVNKAVQETGVDAMVEKVEDIQKIMSYNILMTPGLVIDGYVKVAGRIPKLEEVKRLILDAEGRLTGDYKGEYSMDNDHKVKQVLVIPCSGIGKVQGLISREVVYRVTETLMPDEADTVCLALLVTDDSRRVKRCANCRALPWTDAQSYAQKNVELSGGKISQAFRVYDALKHHRGQDFGSPTALSLDGWSVVDEMADQIAETARRAIT